MMLYLLINHIFSSQREYSVVFLLLFLWFSPIPSYAQTFEDFKRADQDRLQQSIEVSKQQLFDSASDWDQFRSDEIQRYESYRKEMLQKWGDFKERTKTKWVEYRDNGNVRSSVDFEAGTVEIEILVEGGLSEDQIGQKTKEEVLNTIRDHGTVTGISEGDESSQDLQQEPLLNNQISNVSSPKDEEVFAENLSKDIAIQQKTGSDGKIRNVITINFSLAPDHIQTRAEKFKDYVYSHSEVYDLDPALVFAIIHTESFYNPAARSHANALGLMQLVPNSGGRDAYQHVYKKDGIPSPQYLLNPENNVKLGTAYVDILSNNYLRGVENSEVKNYLVIAAYNTGAGNVSRAFINSTNIKSAFAKINEMSPKETFEYLIRNLPYDETKDYLKKVVERREMYQEWRFDEEK